MDYEDLHCPHVRQGQCNIKQTCMTLQSAIEICPDTAHRQMLTVQMTHHHRHSDSHLTAALALIMGLADLSLYWLHHEQLWQSACMTHFQLSNQAEACLFPAIGILHFKTAQQLAEVGRVLFELQVDVCCHLIGCHGINLA